MTVLLEKLTVRLRLESANSGRPIAGRAVWLDDELQITDEAGWVTFTSVLPAAGRGDWPELRFETHADELRLTLPVPTYAEKRPSVTGGRLMMATVTGDPRRGFTASRTVRL